MKDIKSKVYNALSEIMFESNTTQKEMNEAIEWFQIHFYEAEETDAE